MSEPKGRVGTGSVTADISNAVVRLLSEYTGRGPTRARTYIQEDLVTVVLRDTLTNGERSLVAAGRTDVVLTARQAYQQAMKADLISVVERCCGRQVDAFLSENHIEPDIAIESFVLAPIATRGDSAGPDGHSAGATEAPPTTPAGRRRPTTTSTASSASACARP